MAEGRSGARTLMVFVVVAVVAVVAVAFLVRSNRSPDAASGGRPDTAEADTAPPPFDSLEAAVARAMVAPTYSLLEVADRAGIPVDTLVAELGLPRTVSIRQPLSALLPTINRTQEDVRAAAIRVRHRVLTLTH